jgi:hypothetical protein
MFKTLSLTTIALSALAALSGPTQAGDFSNGLNVKNFGPLTNPGGPRFGAHGSYSMLNPQPLPPKAVGGSLLLITRTTPNLLNLQPQTPKFPGGGGSLLLITRK